MAVHEARHAPVTSNCWHAARQRDFNAKSAKKRTRTLSIEITKKSIKNGNFFFRAETARSPTSSFLVGMK
jgi:hypothetical protein